jgi:hypothetical protein
VTVPLATLLGLAETPGELDGTPIPAEIARSLAADGRWRRMLLDESGAVLDLGRSTYTPSAELRRFLEARDHTCRFPSCTRPAVRCDTDHTRGYHSADGRTDAANLVCLCRHHHRLKEETPWSYRLRPDRSVLWTAPSGRTYLNPPLTWTHHLPDPPDSSSSADRKPPPDGPDILADDPSLNAYLATGTQRRLDRATEPSKCTAGPTSRPTSDDTDCPF